MASRDDGQVRSGWEEPPRRRAAGLACRAGGIYRISGAAAGNVGNRGMGRRRVAIAVVRGSCGRARDLLFFLFFLAFLSCLGASDGPRGPSGGKGLLVEELDGLRLRAEATQVKG